MANYTEFLHKLNCGILVLFWSSWLVSHVRCSPLSCASNKLTFEVVTGYVYTSPDDTLELVPGTLHLTECLSFCRQNASCLSVNFETGLCVLFSSSAKQKPTALTVSQFPVFTIYAQKICFKNVQPCGRQWAFERVFQSELLDRSRKRGNASSVEECMELCLSEREFECRSANYHSRSATCLLSDVDRHSTPPTKYFVPAGSGTEYLENNCVDLEAVRLCEFRKVSGKILKTVDAVFQDIKTLESCRKKCLAVDYRCQSFDLGDPTNSVCRLSHLSSASLTHIEDPYLEIPGAATFEVAACYDVTIQCRSREMVAFVRTSKLFNGKVYAKSRPNSCVTDVVNSLEFEIRMAYHDLNCDVKQQGVGEFTNDIVIQHHDMIVTNQDLGVTVHCQYDLANKSIAHGVKLDVDNDVKTHGVHSVSVSSPNVTLRVTDRFGRDLRAAQVGDPLALRFEITDSNSPYEIFVRELVAMDGIDNSEILLIDALGCPTDPFVMGPITKLREDGRFLQASFDAFKFPTSEMVQFKALVTPCLSSCQPAPCDVRTLEGTHQKMESMGKKKKRRKRAAEVSSGEPLPPEEVQEEVIVIRSIHVTDKFGFDSKQSNRLDDLDFESSNVDKDFDTEERDALVSTCLNMSGIVVACSLFLVAQLVVLLAYAFVWHKRTKTKTRLKKENNRSIDMIYNLRRENSCTEACGIDNPYRSDITPYDTMYNLPQSQSRHY